MSKYRKTIKQIILFGLVGVGSLIIDVTITTISYKYFHVPAAISGIFGFIAAFGFNFPLNRKKVFKHENNSKYSLKLQIVFYFILCIFNIIVTAAFMYLLVDRIHLVIFIAKVSTTAFISIYNYFILRFIIFSQNSIT